jgi:hypothetical protein
VPGMRGVYADVSPVMRADLKAASAALMTPFGTASGYRRDPSWPF